MWLWSETFFILMLKRVYRNFFQRTALRPKGFKIQFRKHIVHNL